MLEMDGNGWKWMKMVKYPMQTIANSSLNTILSIGRFCQLEKFKLPNTNHVALQQHQQQAWFQKVYTPEIALLDPDHKAPEVLTTAVNCLF